MKVILSRKGFDSKYTLKNHLERIIFSQLQEGRNS